MGIEPTEARVALSLPTLGTAAKSSWSDSALPLEVGTSSFVRERPQRTGRPGAPV